MEWELSKENVQPLKTGRNVEVLNDVLKAKAEGPARSSIFESQRRQLLEDIENYAGEDPLVPWIRYIKWVNDAYPAGGAQSELLKVLERCTRKFQKDERYRCDVRYLRIWVQYADCCPDPSDVFAFLQANEIGQDHALFYEAYATSMEVRRKFSTADEIYHLGLQRSAQPLGRLESMYRSFLNRMIRRGERKLREEQQPVPRGLDENEVQLRSFGPHAVSSGDAVGQQARRHRARPVPVPPPHQQLNKRENRALPIFVDPEFGGLPKVDPQEAHGKEKQAAPWSQMGGEADKAKENAQQPVKWSDAKIGQEAHGQHGPRSDLNILVDEEFAEGSNHNPPEHVSKSTAPSLRLRLEDMQKTRRHSPGLKGSFLDFPDPPSMTQGSAKHQSESSRTVSTQDGPASRSHPGPVFAYDTTILSGNGTEQSFEEFRLTIWNVMHQVWHTEDKKNIPANFADPEKLEDAPSSLLPRINQDSQMAKEPHLSNELAGITRNVNAESDVQVIVSHLEREPATAKTESLIDYQIQPQKPILPSSSPEQPAIFHLNPSNSFTMQGDETVAIKRFAEEVIVLGSDPKVNSIDAVSHHGLVEPTINTKEALADILDMFSKPLECANTRPKSRKPKDTKKRSNNPVAKSSGFQIFVDENLNEQSTREAKKKEKRVRASSGGLSADPVVQVSGFQTCEEENLDVQGCADTIKNANPISQPFDLMSPSTGLHIYEDEELHVVGPDNSKKIPVKHRASISQSPLYPVFQSGAFDIFADKDLDLRRNLNPDDVQREEANTAASDPLNPVSDLSDFQVYIDDDLVIERCLQPRRNDSMLKASTNKSALGQSTCVDDDFRELSLTPDQLDGKMVKGQHQDHFSLVKDKGTARRSFDPDNSVVHEAPTTSDAIFREERTFKELASDFEERPPEPNVADSSNSESSKRSVSLDIRHLPKLTRQGTTSPLLEQKVNAAAELRTVNPWDERSLQDLLARLKPQMTQYEGFLESSEKYSGSIPISSLRSSNARNKILQLGPCTYRLKGCIGHGAFAQIFEVEDEEDDLFGNATKLALKFQKPACPWEFYIYRQLDMRICNEDRSYYGQARRFHLYTDSSFMVCEFGEHGTLQDVVNAYLAMGQRMDEVLCIFYTIEMLRMLDILHGAGIIHGDFKPDNLLIRDGSDELDAWTADRLGCWKSQGLSLIDWGRSIDLSLHPEGTQFVGDCKTDSFRCPEMLEHRPWCFQVDTFGLCGVVHCLLHGNYMQIEKTQTADGRTIYRPKSPYRRYWNVELWRGFFETLLNVNTSTSRDNTQLSVLRQAFEDHLTANSLGKKLKGLLAKQTIMMFTRG